MSEHIERLKKYVASRTEKPLRGVDSDLIGEIHSGTEWFAELRLSDIAAVLAENMLLQQSVHSMTDRLASVLHKLDTAETLAQPEQSGEVDFSALDWPDDPRFRVMDDPDPHQPCWLVMPDGAMLAFVHHAKDGVDQARAKFVADACNSALDDSQPAKAAQHSDDQAVDQFAAMLKSKLAKARAKGRDGWREPSWTAADINRQMHEHAAKGDPLDVAAYAMFLALRGEATSAQTEQHRDSGLVEVSDELKRRAAEIQSEQRGEVVAWPPTEWPSIQHECRPATADEEVRYLSKSIGMIGLSAVAMPLRSYALQQPGRGSFAGSLWALYECVSAMTAPPAPVAPCLAAFDAAVAAVLPRVSHLEFDSHEICKHFAGKVREHIAAAPTVAAKGVES